MNTTRVWEGDDMVLILDPTDVALDVGVHYQHVLWYCRNGESKLIFHIEDIYFFEVNTKYISSSELKTSKFSQVRSTSENLDVFKSRDEIYLVFTDKK